MLPWELPLAHLCLLDTHGCCGEDAATGLIPAGDQELYCTCQVSKTTPVPTTFLLCWEWITKLTGSLGSFPKPCQGL